MCDPLMFYSKLQVVKNGYVVYPFPDHDDYQEMLEKEHGQKQDAGRKHC